MSGTSIYIYTDVQSSRILLVKPTINMDFSLESSQFFCHRIDSPLKISRTVEFDFVYSPEGGVQRAEPMAAADRSRLSLLRVKIRTLLLVKTNVLLIKKDIVGNANAIFQLPLSGANLPLVWRFMDEERKAIFQGAEQFMGEFQGRIENSKDVAEVEAHYRHLETSVNLGVYAPMNRERKLLGVATSWC